MRGFMPACGHRWIPPALLVAFACGCEDPPQAPSSVDAPSDVLVQTLDPAQTIGLTEDLRLGGDDASALYGVWAAELDDAGRIYVLERGNLRISVFDESGTLVRRIGRQGEGPGEFIGLSSMTLRRDTLVVGDSRNRIHVFLSGGTHILTRMHAVLGTTGDGWYIGSGITGTPNGWLVPAQAFFQRDADGNDAKLPPLRRMKLFTMDARGDLDEAGLYWSHAPKGEWDGIFWVQAPYPLRPAWTIDGLGRVLVADTDDYVIDVFAADGSPIVRIHNEVERRPITQDLLDEYEASLCPSGPECSQDRNRRKMAMSTLDYLPEVAALKGFPSGHFAARRAYTDPDPDDRIIAGDWDLFAPDGTFLGKLPFSGTPLWFDGETLLAAVRDDMDVQYVVRYRVDELRN